MSTRRFLRALREILTAAPKTDRTRRRKADVSLQGQVLDARLMLTTNLGVVRPDLGDPNDLMLNLLDNEPLTGGRDASEEFSFHYGFSATSDGGAGQSARMT